MFSKILVGACFAVAFSSTSFAAPQKIAAHTDEQLAPFIWEWMDPVTFTEAGLQKVAAKKDPLRPFFLAFRLLVLHERTGDKKALRRAERALEFMLNEYEPTERTAKGQRWFYGFDYEGIKAPWWSGMDGFFGPMTLYAGWQATGKAKYRDAAVASAKLALLPPTQGGVLWRDKNGCWISEYAWKGLTVDKEFFVINGHLWGLQALYMLAEASGDAELKEAYACARKGTFSREEQFYNKDKSWTWYQLNPKVINPTHYNLIELAQFRAMRTTTGDAAYGRAEEARARAFQRSYPLTIANEKSGKLSVLFSMVGAPHPYWTDTYPISVACTVNGREVKVKNDRTYRKSEPLDQRLVVTVPVSATPSSCRVSFHSNVEVEAYKQTDFATTHVSAPTQLPISPSLEMDARTFSNGAVNFNPAFETVPLENVAANDEGRITLPLKGPIGANSTIALVLNAPEPLQLGLFLEDVKGNRSTRSYPDLVPNRDNLVMLHRLGFDRNDDITASLKSITLRVYTSGVKQDFPLKIKSFQVINNAAEMREFFAQNRDAHFPQQ